MRLGRVTFGLTVLLIFTMSGLLTAVACGSSSKSATPTPEMTIAPGATSTKAPLAGNTVAPKTTSTVAATAAPQQASVTIKDFEFTPATATIKVGGTVTWTNNGPSTHTVTGDGGIDSGDLSKGKTYSKTFDKEGTFNYHCSIHPSMTAQVIVEKAAGSSASAGY